MKIVLFGTGQVEIIGRVLGWMINQGDINVQLSWNRSLDELSLADAMTFFHALDDADRIYAQVTHERAAGWSTKDLCQYFPIEPLPILLSHVSAPQLGYSLAGITIPEHLRYFDFRLLELYPENVSVEKAARIYHDVRLAPADIDAGIEELTAAYRTGYNEGFLCFDYADFYYEHMQKNADSYFAVDQPGNVHLEWLVNSILRDCGFGCGISLVNGAPLMANFRPPKLGEPNQSYLTASQNCSLELMAKIYYYFFDTMKQSRLEEEFYASSYYTTFRSERGRVIPTVSHEDTLDFYSLLENEASDS